MALSRASIQGLADRPTIIVPVPEWGQDVAMRCLSGAEMDEIYQAMGLEHNKRFIQCVTAMSLCDETGARIYTPETSAELFERSATALGRLVLQAIAINRLGAEAQDDARKD